MAQMKVQQTQVFIDSVSLSTIQVARKVDPVFPLFFFFFFCSYFFLSLSFLLFSLFFFFSSKNRVSFCWNNLTVFADARNASMGMPIFAS